MKFPKIVKRALQDHRNILEYLLTILDFCLADNERVSCVIAFILLLVVVVGGGGGVLLLLHSITLCPRLIIPWKEKWGVRDE